MLSAIYSANHRILDWQAGLAKSSEDPALLSSTLLLEHHRLLEALTRYAINEEPVSRDDLLIRVEQYRSQFQLLLSHSEIFQPTRLTQRLPDLPPDSYSRTLGLALGQLRQSVGPALNEVERQISFLKAEDLAGYTKLRMKLDSFSDELAQLQMASFERQEYLDHVQVAVSDQLNKQLRNAFIGIGAGVMLLSYVFMLYRRQRQQATETLTKMNRQLRTEIKESERLGQELSLLARQDSLSGLLNRFGFTEALKELLSTARGSHGLCFVDLDLFKVVNDTCGYAAGDELIRDVARLLRQALPEKALVGRFGGDEFIILLPNCTQSAFSDFIDGCCADLQQHVFTYSDQRFDVSGSFGATYFNARDYDMHSLLGVVDAACHEAKNVGGSRVHLHYGDDEIVKARQVDLYWVAAIQNALNEQRFTVLRQPIMALNESISGRPDHWEVLVRMIGPDGALIAPGEFFDVAERYSLAPRIDRWVIDRSFQWLNANHTWLGREELVNINLSGVSIADPDFLVYIEKLTQTLLVPTANVCFEITETAAAGQRAQQFIVRLKELGFRIALDDFGMGFSSFGYLESLPVDYIKIDGFFVSDIEHNRVHREFVRAINDIGKVMGKQTVAEYVDTRECLSMLRRMGVNYAQGYHISKPTPMTMPEPGETISKPLPGSAASVG